MLFGQFQCERVRNWNADDIRAVIAQFGIILCTIRHLHRKHNTIDRRFAGHQTHHQHRDRRSITMPALCCSASARPCWSFVWPPCPAVRQLKWCTAMREWSCRRDIMFTSETTPNAMDIEFDVKLLSTVYPDSTSVSCGGSSESIAIWIMDYFLTDRIW